MVSAKLSSRLGAVKTSEEPFMKREERPSFKRTEKTRITTFGPSKNTVLGLINNHLSTSEKDKVKLTKKPEARKAPVIAVNKSGSRIQVVSKAVSPRKTLKSASARRRETYGTMRCDEVRKDTHRKPAFVRTDLKSLKFEVKASETDLLGIDLKSVSLKRKINNDESSTKVGKFGALQRTVANKRDKKIDSDSEEEKPKPKSEVKKSHRAIYKTALNDVLENKKKAKTEAETRKRTSRVKVKEMRKESSDESRSPSPVPKKKKATKKVTKKESESESAEESVEEVPAVIRRPGERGKSAAKEKLDVSEDAFSPIEGYRLKVSNLNASVSESDLVDLFCAIGAIRDARLTSTPGSAIITFVKRAAAIAAVTKYNGRELDKQKISVTAHRVMDLPSKTPYQWRNEYPTKKPRMRQELVGEIAASILLPALAGVVTIGAKPVVFTVKV